MKTEREILDLLAPICSVLGYDPADLVSVLPSHGGWLNALRFKVVRADNATTWVSRDAIDSASEGELVRALRQFSYESHPVGGATQH